METQYNNRIYYVYHWYISIYLSWLYIYTFFRLFRGICKYLSKGKAETNDVKYNKTITLIKKVILLGIQQLVCQYIFFASHDYVGLKVYTRIRLSYMKILFTMDQTWFDKNKIIYNEIATKIINETNVIKEL